jgi:hypothetical protein
MTAVVAVGDFVAIRSMRILALLLLLIVLSLSSLQVASGWLLISPLLLPRTILIQVSSPPSYFSNTSNCTPKSIISRSFQTILFQSKNNNQNVDDGDEDKNSDDSNSNNSDVNKLVSEVKEVEWGVSYIGGDPCGSKYNDDPFDANKSSSSNSNSNFKPGLPDDMKARIQALAEQKLRQREQ